MNDIIDTTNIIDAINDVDVGEIKHLLWKGITLFRKSSHLCSYYYEYNGIKHPDKCDKNCYKTAVYYAFRKHYSILKKICMNPILNTLPNEFKLWFENNKITTKPCKGYKPSYLGFSTGYNFIKKIFNKRFDNDLLNEYYKISEIIIILLNQQSLELFKYSLPRTKNETKYISDIFDQRYLDPLYRTKNMTFVNVLFKIGDYDNILDYLLSKKYPILITDIENAFKYKRINCINIFWSKYCNPLLPLCTNFDDDTKYKLLKITKIPSIYTSFIMKTDNPVQFLKLIEQPYPESLLYDSIIHQKIDLFEILNKHIELTIETLRCWILNSSKLSKTNNESIYNIFCLPKYEYLFNKIDSRYMNCLWYTIECNNVDLFNLLKSKCNIEHKNQFGDNILHFSLRSESYDTFIELMSSGISNKLINDQNKFGETPLMIAINKTDSIKYIKILLQNKNIRLDLRNCSGDTFAHMIFNIPSKESGEIIDLIFDRTDFMWTGKNKIPLIMLPFQQNDKKMVLKMLTKMRDDGLLTGDWETSNDINYFKPLHTWTKS
jgi:ankyrin repeat protein